MTTGFGGDLGVPKPIWYGFGRRDDDEEDPACDDLEPCEVGTDRADVKPEFMSGKA